MNHKVIQSIHEGFQWFINWGNGLIDDNYDIHKNQYQWFLHWQTFDLLKITYYGFLGWAQQSFKLSPSDEGYFISTLRQSGSKIESLFSQLQNMKGGGSHFTLEKYVHALCVKKVSTIYLEKSDGYRSSTLNIEGEERPLSKNYRSQNQMKKKKSKVDE